MRSNILVIFYRDTNTDTKKMQKYIICHEVENYKVGLSKSTFLHNKNAKSIEIKIRSFLIRN